MQRLLDHFRFCQDAIRTPRDAVPQAAESCERPKLQRDRFAGIPIWFHPPRGKHPEEFFRTESNQAFHPDDAIACVQFEHYVGESAPSRDPEKGLRSIYYLLKPLLPRALQIELQRLNARRRLQNVDFPAWPQDPTLTDLLKALLAELLRVADQDSIAFLGFWPHGKTWAWSLTHDVDTAIGYAHLDSLSRLEEERGLSSAWYFVPARYKWDASVLEGLRANGHEIGVHGFDHSGKLFKSRGEFEWRRERINEYMQAWKADGFRSPATYRNPFWLTEIDAHYDSSYLDVATLEPQRGGVCAPFPFMLNERLVEIPITLPMDHTMINILRQDPFNGCIAKAKWISEQYGMATALFHPDYNTKARESKRYAALLDRLVREEAAWCALPREIADWWQRRRQSTVKMQDGKATIAGPAALDGRVWWAHREGRSVRIVPASD